MIYHICRLSTRSDPGGTKRATSVKGATSAPAEFGEKIRDGSRSRARARRSFRRRGSRTLAEAARFWCLLVQRRQTEGPGARRVETTHNKHVHILQNYIINHSNTNPYDIICMYVCIYIYIYTHTYVIHK